MLDIKWIRQNYKTLEQIITSRKVDKSKADLDRFKILDEQKSSLMLEIENINKQRNEVANKMQSNPENKEELIEKGKNLRVQLEDKSKMLATIEEEWKTIMSWFPNIMDTSVKIGETDKDNNEIYAWNPINEEISKEQYSIGSSKQKWCLDRSPHWDKALTKPLHHLELLTNLGLVDVEQGGKVSGSRFVYLLKDIVKLQRGIHELLANKLEEKGFFWVEPPLLVNEKVLFGTSHFPEGRDQVYEIKSDYLEEHKSLFLVGSSEPSNFAYFIDKVIDKNTLPQKMMAATSCFRSEVGSWGKDVKGIKRVHQFKKLELDVVCHPSQSDMIYKELMDINIWLMKELELPFHIIDKCSADMGYLASSKQADIEVWLTGQQEFIEVGTDTNTTDYQARRMNIKFRDENGELKFCHTVNDTGAPDRLLIAIADNYQQSNGTIKVPQKLVQYMGKEFIN